MASSSKRRARVDEESSLRPSRAEHIDMDRLYAELLDRRDRLAVHISAAARLSADYVECFVIKHRKAHWHTSLAQVESQYGAGSELHAPLAAEDPFNWDTLKHLDRVYIVAALLAEIETLKNLESIVASATSLQRRLQPPPPQATSSHPDASRSPPGPTWHYHSVAPESHQKRTTHPPLPALPPAASSFHPPFSSVAAPPPPLRQGTSPCPPLPGYPSCWYSDAHGGGVVLPVVAEDATMGAQT